MSATTPKDLDDLEFSNTNAWDTRQLVTMALMCAIAALLSFVQLPLIPGVTFLTYDPSLMPAMVCGFAFGPGAGIAVGAIAAVIHGLILGEWVGSLMNIVATLCFVWPAAAIYRRKRTFKSGIIGLLVGVLAATAGAVVSNLTIGVAFWYGSVDVILPMLLPAILPFNLVKGIVNAILTLIVYKAVSNLITPKKSQVEGPLTQSRLPRKAVRNARMIECMEIEFTYDGEHQALAGIDLKVDAGEFVCVLGGNGSGKSTLAKHLNALLVPDKGSVVVDGNDTAEPRHVYRIRSTAGMVFQNPDDQLVASLVEDDVAFGPENLGVETAELAHRVRDALQEVGLVGFEKHETFALSGGQSSA